MKGQALTIAPKFLKRKTAIKKLREFADTRMERFGDLIESRIKTNQGVRVLEKLR